MNKQELLRLLQDQRELYQRLRGSQDEKVHLYLDRSFDLIEESNRQDEQLTHLIRKTNARLETLLSDSTLEEYLAASEPSERLEVSRMLSELRVLVLEVGLLNQRNEGFVKRSLAYSRAFLQELMPGGVNYNQKGLYQPASQGMEF